jgi:hypothetical protein
MGSPDSRDASPLQLGSDLRARAGGALDPGNVSEKLSSIKLLLVKRGGVLFGKIKDVDDSQFVSSYFFGELEYIAQRKGRGINLFPDSGLSLLLSFGHFDLTLSG